MKLSNVERVKAWIHIKPNIVLSAEGHIIFREASETTATNQEISSPKMMFIWRRG